MAGLMSSANARYSWLPVRRSYYFRLLVAQALRAGLLVFFYAVYSVNIFESLIMGGVCVPPMIGSSIPLLLFFAYLLPDAVYCFLYSDYLYCNLRNDASVVLTRCSSRSTWSLNRVAQLCAMTFSYIIVSNVLSFLVLITISELEATKEALVCLAFSTALESLMVFDLLEIINLFSYKIDPVVSSVLVYGAHVASLLVLANASTDVVNILLHGFLSAHGVLAWHEIPSLFLPVLNGVEGLGLSESLLVLLIVALLLSLLVSRITEGCDVL